MLIAASRWVLLLRFLNLETTIMGSKASADELPMEIMFEILSRLPVESLLRFICVSKSWHSLISSREFIKAHLKTLSKTGDTARRKLIFSDFLMAFNPYISECKLNSALYDPTATEATNIIYPMYASVIPAENIEGKPAEILGFCNGLVCIAIWDEKLCLFLWNPSIRKYRRLPLDFDFENSVLAAYGFAYDELHDDYKVVALLCDYGYSYHNARKEVKDQVVKIYSQRTNSWKRNEDSKNHISLRKWDVIRGGPFTNGKLHWTAFFRGDHHPAANKIVSFDLADETYGEIEFPVNMGKCGYYRWSTGVLGEGCLALLWFHNEQKQKLNVDVWIMTKYGVRESWKMFAIRYPENYGACYLFDLRVQPVFLSKKGEILLKLGNKLVLHNPADDSYKDLQVNYNMPYVSHALKVHMYDESLVLLDAHDGSIE